jgi:hypothetical protein
MIKQQQGQLPSEREGKEAYDRLAEGFLRACSQSPPVERTYLMAGRQILVRVAGKRLATMIGRPLTHLRTTDADVVPELTIDLWDEAETGVSTEGCVLGSDPEAPGSITIYDHARYVSHGSPSVSTVMDRKANHLVGWVGSGDRLTQYEVGRPLHAELLMWHRDRGIQAVHAGLVSDGTGGVLFGGPGGSGKTTTALTSLRGGLAYLADDYVGLEQAADGTWIGHSLYCSSHLTPDHIQRFPDLIPHAIPGRLAREDKSLVLLGELYPNGFAPSTPIRAVVLPRVALTPKTTFRPASKVDVLRQLAPSSLFQLPYGLSGRRSFDTIVALVESVPTWWVDLGLDLDEIPMTIRKILNMGTAT